MKWEQTPTIRETGLASTHNMRIFCDSQGMIAGHITTPENQLEKDLKKRLAEEIAVILETTDGWNTYHTVFRGIGRIIGPFRTGSETWIVQNKRVSPIDWKETTHILARKGNKWTEVSALPLQAVTIWESGGPWLLAIGRLDRDSDTSFLYSSSDGGHSWLKMKLDPLASPEISSKSLLALKPNGTLYKADSTGLRKIDLNAPQPFLDWEVAAKFPEKFIPMVIAGEPFSLSVLGALPGNILALWKWNEAGSVQVETCRGIPFGFNPTKLSVRSRNTYLTGQIELISKGVTSGYDNYILGSKDGGLTWMDLEWPIKGSLNAVDFGENGSVWGIAAGNRIRVYHTREASL